MKLGVFTVYSILRFVSCSTNLFKCAKKSVTVRSGGGEEGDGLLVKMLHLELKGLQAGLPALAVLHTLPVSPLLTLKLWVSG